MENQVMFGEIGQFAEKSYFDGRKYGTLYVDEQHYGLDFFAFVHADAYDFDVFRVNMVEREDKEAYLDMLLQMATNTRSDVPVSAEDRIVLLSTCSSSSTNGRDILIGVLTDALRPDPFAEQGAKSQGAIPAVDTLSHFWNQAGWQMKAIVAVTICLLLICIILLIYTKRKRS